MRFHYIPKVCCSFCGDLLKFECPHGNEIVDWDGDIECLTSSKGEVTSVVVRRTGKHSTGVDLIRLEHVCPGRTLFGGSRHETAEE